MMTLDVALGDLRQTLGSSRATTSWRWMMRDKLDELREALGEDRFAAKDGWLAARSRSMTRDREQLLARLTALGSGLLDRLDTDRVAIEARRLVADVEHYRQRMHDLVYDSVEMEIGGSE